MKKSDYFKYKNKQAVQIMFAVIYVVDNYFQVEKCADKYGSN